MISTHVRLPVTVNIKTKIPKASYVVNCHFLSNLAKLREFQVNLTHWSPWVGCLQVGFDRVVGIDQVVIH